MTTLVQLLGVVARRGIQATFVARVQLRSGDLVHQLFATQPEIMADVKEIVNAKIAGKKVMVFSKSYCPFCTKAKKAFQALINEGVLSVGDYEVMELENDPNCEKIMNYLNTLTGGRTVPRVFVGGQFLGGGDETVTMKANGQLKAKLS